MTVRREILLVVLLTLLAAALRLWNLGGAPPGLFGDEAFYGLDAWRVIRDGWHPIFFEANGGREPLVIYLMAGALWAFGPTVGALRLVPALLGTLTTPVLYALGRTLYGRRAGFLAALAWTVTFAAIAMSRLAFRVVALSFLVTLTLWLLLLALRSLDRRTRWHLVLLLLAGLSLGLTLYTYMPGRVFPLVVAVFLAHWGLTHRARWRAVVSGGVIVFAAAALVYAPLAAYFLATPAAFISRAADIAVTGQANPLQALAQSTIDHLGLIAWRGDLDPVRNLPGLPVLDPMLTLCALLGLLVCLRRLKNPAYALPLVWAVVLFLPALPVRGLADVLHLAGVLPALFLLVGLGAAAAWTWSEQRLSVARRWLPAAVVVILFVVSGAVSIWHYFMDWAGSPATALAYSAPLVDLAEAVNERVKPGGAVFLPWSIYNQTPVAYLTLRTCPRVGGFPSEGFRVPYTAVFMVPPDYGREDSFVMLASAGEGTRFLDPLGPQTIRWLREERGMPVPGRWGMPVARAVRENILVSDSWVIDRRTCMTTFGGQAILSSYDIQGRSETQRPRAIPGEDVAVLVYWEAARVPDGDYRAFVHLLDVDGRVRGGWDGAPVSEVFPTGAWRPGESIPAVYRVPVSPDAPPGKYMLEVGFYHPFTGRRLDAVAADGAPLGSRALLGPLKITTRDTTPTAPPTSPAQANFGGAIELTGYDVQPSSLTVGPGQTLRVALHWRALALTDTDYTVFVHLTDAAGRPVAQHDGQPRTGYPTSIWDVGESVLDEHEFVVPADTAPGAYRLIVGLYDPTTGARLPVLDDAGQPIGDHVLLTTIEVKR